MRNNRISEKELEYMLHNLMKADNKVLTFNIPDIDTLQEKKRRFQPVTVMAVISTVAIIFIVILTPLINNNDFIFPRFNTTPPSNEPNNEQIKVIYGSDDYKNLRPFIVGGNIDYTYNISPLLLKEMEKNKDNVYYRIIIVGSKFSGKDFKNFKFEGYTYHEYEKLLNSLHKLIGNMHPSDETRAELLEQERNYQTSMEILQIEYANYFHIKYKSYYQYLINHYKFISYQEQADFDELCHEDYQLLATASYDTIVELANDNFLVFLAPEKEKEPVIKSMNIFLDNKYTDKLSPRVTRDLARNDTIIAFVILKDINIRKINDAAAQQVEQTYKEIEKDSPEYQSIFYTIRDKLYVEELNNIKQALIMEYKIEKYNITSLKIFPYLICTLSPEQIIQLAQDDRVEFIRNACELMPIKNGLQTYSFNSNKEVV